MCEEKKVHSVTIAVPFPSPRLAEIAYHVLRVDTEPKRSGVTKELHLRNHIIDVKFAASVSRQLRTAVNSFFENVILILQTCERFGPPAIDCSSNAGAHTCTDA